MLCVSNAMALLWVCMRSREKDKEKKEKKEKKDVEKNRLTLHQRSLEDFGRFFGSIGILL